MFRYRRNADVDLRELERAFLNSRDIHDYQRYIIACHRSGVTPYYCQCGGQATQTCRVCSTAGLSVVHCDACSRHVCPGSLQPDGVPCSTDLREAARCDICLKVFCTNEDCDRSVVLETCGTCEARFCEADDCGNECDECGNPTCRPCITACEAHDTEICTGCAHDCNYCRNKCCEQCICCVPECGTEICSNCIETGKLDVCHVCDGRLCEEHSIECSACDKPVCRRHASLCTVKVESGTKCRKAICDECQTVSCSHCSRVNGCPSHFTTCVGCGEEVCEACTEECNNCGENFDPDCLIDHREACFIDEGQVPIDKSVDKPQEMSLQLNERVRLKGTTLLGVIIKLSERDGFIKYIVEWDNDSAGKHSADDLERVSHRRRYY